MLLARVPKTQSQASLDARTLAEYLRHTKADELIPYADLSALIGRHIQRCRWVLDKARDIVRREDHIEFDAIMNQGIQHVAASGFVKIGETGRKRSQRLVRKKLQQLNCANQAELPAGELTQLLAYVSVFGALAALSHFTTMRKVQYTIAQQQLGYRLPVDEVVDALKRRA